MLLVGLDIWQMLPVPCSGRGQAAIALAMLRCCSWLVIVWGVPAGYAGGRGKAERTTQR